MPRTLVIQLGRLGDVIQSTPLIRDLAATGDTVDLLALAPNHQAVLGLSGLATIYTISEALQPIDEAIARNFSGGAIPAEAHELLDALHLPSYDRVVNASHAPLGCWLASHIPIVGAQRYGGLICDGECLYHGAANSYRIASLHFREQNLFNVVDLIRAAPGRLRRNFRSAVPRYPLYANRSDDLPFSLPSALKIALNPGANEKARCWPAENFARLAESLSVAGFVPVLVGAPGDCGACDRVEAACSVPLANFAGRTTIPEMATLLSRCELLVSGDTGAAHLSAAVGTTVVGLFGATAYFAETAPYGEGHLVLQTPISAPMSSISLECVLAAALNRLGRMPLVDLFRELNRHNQAAWETRFLEADADPLGGLGYRPLHRDALTAADHFAQSLRRAFGHSFCGQLPVPPACPEFRRASRRRLFLASISSRPTATDAGATDLEALQNNAESLAQVLNYMQSAAMLGAENTISNPQLRSHSELAATAATLIRSLDALIKLVAAPAWRALAPVVHHLDWRIRMLPKLSPHDTFLACANEYAAAADLLHTFATVDEIRDCDLAAPEAVGRAVGVH